MRASRLIWRFRIAIKLSLFYAFHFNVSTLPVETCHGASHATSFARQISLCLHIRTTASECFRCTTKEKTSLRETPSLGEYEQITPDKSDEYRILNENNIEPLRGSDYTLQFSSMRCTHG